MLRLFSNFVRKNNMGILDFFGKKTHLPKTKDLVWKSIAAKFKACQSIMEQYPGAVWLAWFPQSISDLKQFCLANGLSCPDVKTARNFQSIGPDNKTIVFLEHFPLPDEENEILSKFMNSEIIFLNGLDEALFRQFGGDRIIGLMDKLGMAEDEKIEHQMISNSIKNAQEKIQKKVQFPNQANSAGDWFKINIGA